ncbi:hypothetical protein TNCV_570121 [Trichonephila clavipes]|nr:hypothetical protein TNCV_570121 [Trichonephila clavipes]
MPSAFCERDLGPRRSFMDEQGRFKAWANRAQSLDLGGPPVDHDRRNAHPGDTLYDIFNHLVERSKSVKPVCT